MSDYVGNSAGSFKGVNMLDVVDKIISFESGELSVDEVVVLFQELVDSGLAWSLQNSYGRVAQSLIESGLVKTESIRRDVEGVLSEILDSNSNKENN